MKSLHFFIVLLLLYGCEEDEKDYYPYVAKGGVASSVSGTVIDAVTRKPVPDLEILLIEEDPPYFIGPTMPELPVTIQTTRSDQNGNYHFSFITLARREYVVSTAQFGRYSCLHRFLFKEGWGNNLNLEVLPNQMAQIKMINSSGTYKTEQLSGASADLKRPSYNDLEFRQLGGFGLSDLQRMLHISKFGDTTYGWTLAMKNVPNILMMSFKTDFTWKQLHQEFTPSSADTGYYSFYY